MKFLLPAIILLGTASFSIAQNQSVLAQPTTNPTNNLPDLVVTSVGVLESEDQIGTDAHLIARIENRGSGATKKDVIHGVAFYVDNEFIAWSDTYRQDLKPGQFAILRSSGGPNGSAIWKITPGKHTIRAVVDDAVRIAESNEENNGFETTLEWKTSVATNSDIRTEFLNISPEIYAQLRALQNSGLFKAANTFLRSERMGNQNQIALDFTRYEAAVAMARLQDVFPTLTSDDKAQRLRAIDAATAGAGHKLSDSAVSVLDDKVRALRVEFSPELARLMAKNTGIEVRNIRPMTIKPRISPVKR